MLCIDRAGRRGQGEPWLAGTCGVVSLARGRCGGIVSAITWSAGAAGWAEREVGSGGRGALHDPIVKTIVEKAEGAWFCLKAEGEWF